MKATKVNAGLAESNGRLLLGIWRDLLYVTCGLTACTPGSAPGPTLGNEYGKTLPFTSVGKSSISPSHRKALKMAVVVGNAALPPRGTAVVRIFTVYCSASRKDSSNVL